MRLGRAVLCLTLTSSSLPAAFSRVNNYSLIRSRIINTSNTGTRTHTIFSSKRIINTSSSSSSHHLSTYLAFWSGHRSHSPTFLSKSRLLNPFHRISTTTTTTVRNMSSPSTAQTDNANSKVSRVALLQFNVSPIKAENHIKVQQFISKAVNEQNAKLIILPEIWNGPYATAAFADYAEKLPDLHYTYDPTSSDSETLEKECPSAKILFEAALKYKVTIIGGSISERILENGKDEIYNTCLCISPEGQVVAKHQKVHLFDIDVKGGITFKESDTLSPGNVVSCFDAGEPFGNIGVGICYDIRFPEYALLLSQKHQCNILVYPGAFNLTTGPAHWELLQRARAVDNQCFILTASPARTNPPPTSTDNDTTSKYPHYTAWGHSTVVNPWGEVIGTCDEHEHLVCVDLNMDEVSKMRQGIPIFTQKRHDLYQLMDNTSTSQNK